MRFFVYLTLIALIISIGCVSQQEPGGGENKLTGKKVLMIIAHENFRDEELFHTKEELENVGASITIASTDTSTANGMMGGTANPDITINEVNVDDYDAIVFVGGTGSSVYFDNSKALEIAKQSYNKGKVTAAICIAPGILANSGILN